MWINEKTLGEFTLHADIRYELWKEGKEAPGMLTDAYLASVGYQPITKVYPTYDPIIQYLVPQPSVLVDGVWTKNFNVQALDPAIVANNCQGLTTISTEATAILQSAGLYNLEKIKANFIRQIDTDTDNLIRLVIGERGGEYERAEKESLNYKLEGYTGSVPSSVSAWTAAKGWTDKEAADDIIAAATNWRNLQASLRSERLLCKEQGRASADAAALDAVKARWSAFLIATHGQLSA